jgi:hypothetical protein
MIARDDENRPSEFKEGEKKSVNQWRSEAKHKASRNTKKVDLDHARDK